MVFALNVFCVKGFALRFFAGFCVKAFALRVFYVKGFFGLRDFALMVFCVKGFWR